MSAPVKPDEIKKEGVADIRVILSRRLERILSMIRPGKLLADIGTDHAYIPIAAVSEGLCSRALACDVVPGPLVHAGENIEAAGLSGRIALRQGDGLQALHEERPDRIVIAGMGGPLIQRILLEGEEKIGPDTQLILSPQSELPEFRRFLWENGYDIRREVMVMEDGKYYLILNCVRKGEAGQNPPVSFELRYGKGSDYLDRAEEAEIRRQYIKKDLAVAEQILKQLENNASEAAERRKSELLEQVADAKAALAE